MAGNLIGAGKIDCIYEVLKRGLKLICCFSLILLFFFIWYSELIESCFLNKYMTLDINTESIVHLKDVLQKCMIFVAIYLFFDSFRLLIQGILTVAGDTFFLMASGVLVSWFFLPLPTYFIVVKLKSSIYVAMLIWIVSSFIILATYLARFMQGTWKKRSLLV